MILKRFRNPKVVLLFLIIFVINIFQPAVVFALSGGPSQPEIQSFEPVGTSDMVDLFSGDFNYNIPLLDVEGYPINIAYHSGISMDQEASWVGLGWNINPGAINRDIRGIPDDFCGEVITKEFNMRNNRTFGLTLGYSIETVGYDVGLSLSGSITGTYNNYRGMGIEKSISVGLSAGKGTALEGLSGNIGLTSSSDEGLTIQPSLNFSRNIKNNNKSEDESIGYGVGIGVSSSFNSRGGLKNISISKTVSQTLYYKSPQNKDASSKSGVRHSSSYSFGMPTYTPSIQQQFKTLSVSGKFSLGFEAYTVLNSGFQSAYYNNQKLAETTSLKNAFGYMYSEYAILDDVIKDFNREKDNSYNKNMTSLPLTNFTYDIYSVTGQGVGGSYRPARNDFGYVNDTRGVSTSDSYSIGGEVGVGNLVEIGADASVTDVYGESGVWKENNMARPFTRFKASSANNNYESFYFREANEKTVDDDESIYTNLGEAEPIRPVLDKSIKFSTIVKNSYEKSDGTSYPVISHRTSRSKRNQVLQAETRENIGGTISNNFGIKQLAKFTTYSQDGKRYVYGQPVYNLTQEDVSFAIGKKMVGQSELPEIEYDLRLVNYKPGEDDSKNNKKGLDYYYSKTILPKYAYSYLITEIFSPDYVDSDNVPGPSDGDLGDYTVFVYHEPIEYQWRTPCGNNLKKLAGYNEGLKSDLKDDKANYIYGVKEIRYLKQIKTKNMIADFELEDRVDAHEIKNDGSLGTLSMKRLKSITLKVKETPANINSPVVYKDVKSVNFEYNYELCPKTPNNSSTLVDNGKLTLKKLYFTYGTSSSGRLNPYVFSYKQPLDASNPEIVDISKAKYSTMKSDRWGNYKSNCGEVLGYLGSSLDDFDQYIMQSNLPNQDYPYAQQVSDAVSRNDIDNDAAIWTLNKIILPSGGIIEIECESDDYGYVQDKRAMEMFKVVGLVNSVTKPVSFTPNNITAASDALIDFGDKNDWLIVEMRNTRKSDNSYSAPNFDLEYYNNLFQNEIYFKFLLLIKEEVSGKKHFEYVNGYAKIKHFEKIGSTNYLAIKLNAVKMNDNAATAEYNPIAKAGVQFARLNMPKLAFNGIDEDIDDASDFGVNIINTLISSSMIKNMIQAFKGPNLAVYDNNVAKKFVAGKSFFRLNTPDFAKCGGGLRVKNIILNDNWSEMTNAQSANYKSEKYGQTYEYRDASGYSSGVASYEPMLGGEENPFRTPVVYNIEKTLAPDDQFYQETPFGESFFPGAGVGYSKVKVKDIYYENGIQVYNNTEETVNEFYTAKDFPTITRRTSINAVPCKDDESLLKSIFKISHRDFVSVSQGFSIETNDMHGKPKSIKKYHKETSTPYSSVDYKYQLSISDGKLIPDNYCRVINNKGEIKRAAIGQFFDLVNDYRSEYNRTNSYSGMANVDVFIPIPAPAAIGVPSMWPSKTKQETKFQTATTTKVVQRFGILKTTEVVSDGSFVATENIAYDAETGNVLLTKTTNNYNDSLFSLNIPSWWYYEGMGPAYMNIGNRIKLNVSNGIANIQNAQSLLFEGDEIREYAGSNQNTYYVTEVNSGSIRIMTKGGNYPSFNSETEFFIVRSGRRNMLGENMMTLTTMINPLHSIATGNYERVLTASAVEYSNDWKTFCNCFDGVSGSPHTINPFVNGTKASWIPNKQYTYLTKRTQELNSNNTNIRNDGVFEDFNPFYTITYNAWGKDYNNWTFVTEATLNNPYRGILESKDALDNYNASLYGFKQSLTTAVADNSKYKELGYDHFEDYNPFCADNHFKFEGLATSSQEAHTGNKSMKVIHANTPAILSRELVDNCPIPPPCFTYIGSLTGNTYEILISPIAGITDFACYHSILQGNPIVNVSIINVNTHKYTITGNNWKIKFDNHGKADCGFSIVVSSSDF